MSTMHAVMSRSDVRGLLMRHTGAQVTEELVTSWLSGLAGYSLAECHAAMSAMGPGARRITPSAVAGSCDAARDRAAGSSPPGPAAAAPARGWRPRTSGADRDYHRQAGMRGIRAAYEVMGWVRNADHDLARSVACPFCQAKAWAVCGPLSRNRAGVRELRDTATRMHPSRLESARAQLARRETTTHDQENAR
ncbi:hypothetical protein [Amycolatopsis sp. PS_44_ISF1]|uniref:hypothetical protein n=1 Tax=Amycolatopsis sp. PS_44_ISF1 TaxID=2974917 RepID=UPI0028DF2F81|nr:hypothetical protein [Amycolatopsis sp. PS_44_ISF1]MDT8910913.1 hypothetical protein [Amycolatopsis sp. PS_44_ISF1]